MRFLLGAFLLLVVFAIALSIFKFLVIKLFILSFYIALIGLIVFAISRLMKKA
jgi:hypothetical protein